MEDSWSSERSEIRYGLSCIPFSIRRSDRRATVSLTIEPGGQLAVTAPRDTPIERLNDVVRSCATWVLRRVRAQSDRPPRPSQREFVTGETILYRGRQFRLKVIDKEDPDEPRLWAGWFEVPVPVGLDAAQRRGEVHRRLVADLRSRAETRLPAHLTEVCARLGIERPAILVREQRRRWGSCDTRGILRINWRILQAPVSLVEYVLVHELAHLRFADHGAAFWSLVGRWMPDYEERRRRLRELGPALEW